MKHRWIIMLLLLNLSHANEGSLLFYGNCTACHMERGKKAAPHFSEIKGYYKLAYPTKEEFVTQMSHWVHAPNIKEAKLHDAIKEFQLMPNIAIEESILREITGYLFDCEEF